VSALRLGVVGCGDVGRQYLDTIEALPPRDVELAAVCDANEERLAETGVATRFSSVEAMVASKAVDAVLNLTPTRQHAPISRACLEAGLHVYSEKPLAPSLSEGRELRRLAEEAELVLLCAPGLVLTPAWRTVRQLIADGAIGRPVGARARIDSPPWPWPGHEGDPAWYFEADTGPLRDLGPYAIQMLTDLFGPARSVGGQAACAIRQRPIISGPRKGETIDCEAPDAFSLSLAFDDGRIGSLEVSYCVHASVAPTIEVFGEFGTISFDVWSEDTPLRVCRVEGYEGTPDWSRVECELGSHPTKSDRLGMFAAGVEELVEVIRSRRESPLAADRACHALEIIDLAHEAASRALRTSTTREPVSWDHTAFSVSDLDLAIRFYKEAFGYEVFYEERGEDTFVARLLGEEGVVCDLAQLRSPSSEHALELLVFHGARRAPVPPGTAHVAFRVEDLDLALRSVQSHGAEPLGELIAYPGGRAVYCREPSGTMFELYEET
jgi:predicted dehydrogenase